MRFNHYNIFEKLAAVVFPNVCVCCGRENMHRQRQICSFCLQERFRDANPEHKRASSDSLLPDGVEFQQALWQFDKGGDLQQLLHQLKYEHLFQIGVDLGRKLGERAVQYPELNKYLDHRNALLLPVPLHPRKYRYRGFNQAFAIASGFQKVWGELEICARKSVVRSRNTRTQTGLDLQKRQENMSGAFTVIDKTTVANRIMVIIDDVFTTGSTSFELARTVLDEGAQSVAVLTVGQA